MTEDEFRHGPTPDPASSLEPAGYFVVYAYGPDLELRNGMANKYPPIWVAEHNLYATTTAPIPHIALINFWPLTRAQADMILKTGEIEQV